MSLLGPQRVLEPCPPPLPQPRPPRSPGRGRSPPPPPPVKATVSGFLGDGVPRWPQRKRGGELSLHPGAMGPLTQVPAVLHPTSCSPGSWNVLGQETLTPHPLRPWAQVQLCWDVPSRLLLSPQVKCPQSRRLVPHSRRPAPTSWFCANGRPNCQSLVLSPEFLSLDSNQGGPSVPGSESTRKSSTKKSAADQS